MAIVDSTKLTCSIDFDDEWIQEDCHWGYDRIFTFTYEILDNSLANKQFYFYYRLSESDDYTSITELKNIGNTYYYTLRLSSIDQSVLINKRTDEGWLNIGIKVIAGSETATASYDYYLQLPPNPVKNSIIIEQVVDNPGEFHCYWDKTTIANSDELQKSNVDSVDGYCIELFCKPEGDKKSKITGISYDISDLNTYEKYKLIKTDDDDNTEVYLETKVKLRGETDFTETESNGFYFIPKNFEIQPGDEFSFTVYPYSHYEGALLTPNGTSSSGKVSKGIVRVRVNSGWTEGQVYVLTADGWKQAEGIYIRTNSGWAEAQ